MAKRKRKKKVLDQGSGVLSAKVGNKLLSELRGLVLEKCALGPGTTSMRAEVEGALVDWIKKHKKGGFNILPRPPGQVRVGPPFDNNNRTKNKKG